MRKLFRRCLLNEGSCRVVVNNLGETPCEVRCGGEAVTLPAFGVRELTVY